MISSGTRDCGIGKTLILAAIKAARGGALRTLRVDTIPQMDPAQRLYDRLGVLPIEPSYYNPIPSTVYW